MGTECALTIGDLTGFEQKVALSFTRFEQKMAGWVYPGIMAGWGISRVYTPG